MVDKVTYAEHLCKLLAENKSPGIWFSEVINTTENTKKVILRKFMFMYVTPKRQVHRRQLLGETCSLHNHGSEVGKHQRSYKTHHRIFLRKFCTCLPGYIPKYRSHAAVPRYLVISYAVFHTAPISETTRALPIHVNILPQSKSDFLKSFSYISSLQFNFFQSIISGSFNY